MGVMVNKDLNHKLNCDQPEQKDEFVSLVESIASNIQSHNDCISNGMISKYEATIS